jgi:hypothetical protein
MYAAWVLAAGAIAVTVGIVATELLSSIGIADRSGPSYGRFLSLFTGVAFVVLALVPFVYRRRFTDGPSGTESS